MVISKHGPILRKNGRIREKMKALEPEMAEFDEEFDKQMEPFNAK
jgi:hypothetical protein